MSSELPSRIEERDRLLIGLGMLLDPIHRLLFSEKDERARIPYVRSDFRKDMQHFRSEAMKFCRPDDHGFEVELDRILQQTEQCGSFVDAVLYPENIEGARGNFMQHLGHAQAAIRAVPCYDPGTILPSQSPYSTYIRLRAMFTAATRRLDLFDPFLDVDTFHRYLPTIPPSVHVTVVTSTKIMSVATNRRDRIVAISELLAAQYPSRYQLRVSSEEHDRHVRIDETILHLGGSVKDAGKQDYFTISHLAPIQLTHDFLDRIIAQAAEWYGPAVKQHRRS
jgi:hypothetical protein